MSLERIRCADIASDPYRTDVTPAAIEPLAESVRLYGVLKPVLLRATDNGFAVVHGERRLHAARLAGLESVPAYVVDDLLHRAAGRRTLLAADTTEAPAAA